MKTYEIEQTATAVILWTGEAESAQAALDALARDAGYKDHADARETVGGEDTLEVRELLGAELVQWHLERIGVADSGQGGCIAQEVEERDELVEILDEQDGGQYLTSALLPILVSTPADLASTFTAGHDGETAESKAYEHFWQTIASAEVE